MGLLGSLYLSQGLPYGFFTQALPVLLRTSGLSLPAIGAANMLALPWMLKFLWAPVVDRTPSGALGLGRRRAWILILQGLTVVTVAGLAAADPSRSLTVVMAGTLITNLLAATQDVATDGLAVELLEPRERGLGNGLQVAAYRGGMIIGGGALLWLFDRAGWSAAFLAMAALLFLASVPIALHAERPLQVAPPVGNPLGDLRRAATRPGMLPWLALLALFKVGEAAAGGMLRPMLVDLGLGLDDIGALIGVAGSTAGLAGALGGGLAVTRLGARRAVLLFGLMQSAAVALWALPAAGFSSGPVLLLASLAEHGCSGLATVSVFTVMMAACRRDEGHAGTDYTLQASAFVVSSGVGAALSGLLAQAVGYAAHFAVCGALSALGALLLAGRMEGALGELSGEREGGSSAGGAG